MNQVTFTAGYGDPTRTIRQKYCDYGKIEQLRSTLGIENTKLEQRISELEAQKTSLIESFKNLTGLNKTEIQEKIQMIKDEIARLQNKIEQNRDTVRQAWYGYHERY